MEQMNGVIGAALDAMTKQLTEIERRSVMDIFKEKIISYYVNFTANDVIIKVLLFNWNKRSSKNSKHGNISFRHQQQLKIFSFTD